MTKINQNVENAEVETKATVETQENQERCTDNPCAANPCAVNPCEDNGEANADKKGEQVDLFSMMGIAPPPAPKPKKAAAKKAAKAKSTATKAKPAKKSNTLDPNKLPKDIPVFVVLTNHNYQNTFDPGTTLEEIRQQLELEYPFLTKQNTKWTVEVQKLKDGRVYYEEVKPSEDAEDKDTTDGDNAEQPEEVLEEGVTKRIIAIPTAMSNKAG